MGVIIEGGPIWSIDWHKSFVPSNSQKGKVLGMVALACGSGDVLVFCVPKPQGKEHVFIKPKLMKRLTPTPQKVNIFGQCMQAKWTNHDGNLVVLAGFATGHIGIFHVETKSHSLLGPKSSTDQVIYPVRMVAAHRHMVTCIQVCPFDAKCFVSAAYDRFIHLWNLDDVSCSVRRHTQTCISWDVAWEVLYNGIYVSACREFVQKGFNGLVYYDFSNKTVPVTTVVPFSTSCTSVSFNPWLNCLLSADSSGHIVLSAARNPTEVQDPRVKSKRNRRIMMSQCRPRWPKEGDELNQNIDDCMIDFDDFKMDNFNHFDKTYAYEKTHKNESFPDESFKIPLSSVATVRWNPNKNSCSWFASGSRPGFVRIQCASGFVTGNFTDQFDKFS